MCVYIYIQIDGQIDSLERQTDRWIGREREGRRERERERDRRPGIERKRERERPIGR